LFCNGDCVEDCVDDESIAAFILSSDKNHPPSFLTIPFHQLCCLLDQCLKVAVPL
jgi:hypothetical protein